MNRPFELISLPLAALTLAACATTTGGQLERLSVPDEEARKLALERAAEEQREFQVVLLKLDQAMESYARALSNRGVARADIQAEHLEKLIADLVLDRGAQSFEKVASEPGKADPLMHSIGRNYDRLQAAAIDGTNPFHQGIALAALGFSGDVNVMPTILQGAQLDDSQLIDRAVFGLAILRAPATPPGVLARVIENRELPEGSRTQAAWALYRVQERSSRNDEILAIWKRLATHDGAPLPNGVLVQAVRGLGFTRDKAHAEFIVPFLDNPTALLRMAAADALARMNAQEHAENLIDLLGPAESVPNVRLHARKALQALAGNVDYGYDVAAWRKAFERK